MKYRKIGNKKWKYRLAEDYVRQLAPILNLTDIWTPFICFFPSDGLLKVSEYYAWDGASGPTIDTKDSMKASLVHDALYQLMRAGLLPVEYRKFADYEFKKILVEEGMGKWRVAYWHWAVRTFAKSCATERKEKIYEV